MTLNIGILGAGQAGARHITGFSGLDDVRIAAVADSDLERARMEADRCGARPFGNWLEAIETGQDLDAVVVALPHDLHVQAVEKAAARGLHVLLEKPMGTTATESQRILDACRQADILLSICFVHRFREEARLAFEWIASGHIGQPVSCVETIATARGPELGAWIYDPRNAGGGALLYSGVHALDRLLWLGGGADPQVSAAIANITHDSRVEEAVAALIQFQNGGFASFSVNSPNYPSGRTGWRSEIYGTEGLVRIRARESVEICSKRMNQVVDVRDAGGELGEHYNFRRQAEAFVQTLTENGDPPVPGECGLAVMTLAQSIYAAAS